MSWYLAVLKKYAVFEGRARRREYWFFALFNFLIGIVLGLIAGVTGAFRSEAATWPVILVVLYALAVFIPGLAVSVRRLHDTNRSGWWLLIGFVPLVGSIVLLVFYLLDSQPGENQYGPNPKMAQA